MISRTVKRTKRPIRKNFLNKAQRKALSESLKDRFVKDFGRRNPACVRNMIDAFFNSGNPINSESVKILEKDIRRAVIEGADSRQNGRQNNKKDSVTFQKKVEEASDQEYTQTATFGNETSSGDLRPTLLNYLDGEIKAKIESGEMGLNMLDGMIEEEEMGCMNTVKGMRKQRLRNYMELQQREIRGRTKALGHQLVRDELDKQMEELEQKKQNEERDEADYVDAMNKLLEETEKEKENERLRKDAERIRRRAKEDKVIMQRQAYIEKDMMREKAKDLKLVGVIAKDLENQKKMEEQRAIVRIHLLFIYI